jgi:hypothetical protein
MIDVSQRRDRLLAEHAFLSFIPLRHDIPHQAVFRIGLDLFEAFLAAGLPLGPARASVEMHRRLFVERAQSCFFGVDTNPTKAHSDIAQANAGMEIQRLECRGLP